MSNEEIKVVENPYESPQVECMEDLVFSTLHDDTNYRYLGVVLVLCLFATICLVVGLLVYFHYTSLNWIPQELFVFEIIAGGFIVAGITRFLALIFDHYERRVKSPIYIDKRIVAGIEQSEKLKRLKYNWADLQSICLEGLQGLHVTDQSGNQTCIITSHLQDVQLENLAAIIDRYDNRTSVQTDA
ncbi:MAG: hypothetical protein COA78_01525 [Blastopirellula sp.]|nr:MAG: hypothetical protein COA78_01525 [Blastopirellula sp.]